MAGACRPVQRQPLRQPVLPASEPDPANRRTAFVAEALRQLRRMPEYRTGRRRIDVAPGLGAPTGA
ncbi:MAG: hypothetical protein FH759_09120 [Sediminimonas qiaohouensis]|uniref:Uncharacterized protein n=1 Tax=Sediminimonas qiaohouensis TaxID=552061 RepID=A0A7C9LS88_9RHOB|nr:hypothetical protein [Sediminimonas qiaohouensis]MTJ04836.1 hypothetical protein [Sediminimonas qiaohouensis]